MNQAERRRYLIDALATEEPRLAGALASGELAGTREAGNLATAPASERHADARRPKGLTVPADAEGQRRLLRSLMNLRPPRETAPELLVVQGAYLRERVRERGVVTLAEVKAAQATPAQSPGSHILLWRGDTTLLAVDAIVNAANEQGLGCFVPCHACIDNAIHTFAGMQLRLACERELAQRATAGLGSGIRPGSAMITPGFNLPAHHVIHTVGPVVTGLRPRPRDEATLAACYTSCLNLARERGLSSIAFCCISTGVFGYPAPDAARVAVSVVRDWLATHPSFPIDVIFDVFSETDLRIYQRLLN